MCFSLIDVINGFYKDLDKHCIDVEEVFIFIFLRKIFVFIRREML